MISARSKRGARIISKNRHLECYANVPTVGGEVEEGIFGGGEAGEDFGAGQDAAVGEDQHAAEGLLAEFLQEG